MAGKNPFPLNHDKLLQCYRTMGTIRAFEERLHIDFGRGDIPGFVHLYAGEEAAATFLPAELLAPAHMRAGATIGLNVALDDDGRPVRQFYCDKGNDGWRTPIMWGAIRLAE